MAAPFCLEETSKRYTEDSSGNGGGYSDIPGYDWSDLPDQSKLDCLTCGGDGDCTKCNGYGEVRVHTAAGDFKESCSNCRGSGDCPSCDGSGTRD